MKGIRSNQIHITDISGVVERKHILGKVRQDCSVSIIDIPDTDTTPMINSQHR